MATKSFKLPKYLRLARGSMWFDTEGEGASGVKLFAINTMFVGRGKVDEEKEIARDKFDNKNFVDYGFVDAPEDLPWYIDTSKIPPENLSRIILAYKNGILIKTDGKAKPAAIDEKERAKNFKLNNQGERVFIGQNKEMYKKLQNMSFDQLRKFVNTCPLNSASKNNLIDLFHYEQEGYNALSRPRLEVLDLIRAKLKEFGPSMSAIRVNEDE